MKKYSKDDLKSPDLATQELQQGFSWTVRHSKLVLSLIFIFVVVGAGISLYQALTQKKESELQESYFKIEKEYLQKKELFAGNPEAGKAAVKSTGDLSQDFGDLNVQFEKLIQTSPGSKAAAMSALVLSEIYSNYQQKQKAADVLGQVKASSDLLSALVLDRKAGIQADLGDCKVALKTWDELLSNKSAGFMSSEVKVKKGLCFENMKDFSQAQVMYKQAMEADKNSTVAKTAEKYLKLLPN